MDNLEDLFPQFTWQDRFGQIPGDLKLGIHVAAIAGAANNYRNGTVGKIAVDRMDQIPAFSGIYFWLNYHYPDVMIPYNFQNAFYFSKSEDTEGFTQLPLVEFQRDIVVFDQDYGRIKCIHSWLNNR